MHKKVLWITRTAVLLALLIAVQWATSPTQAFAGQYITGSLVNCVLAVAALLGGFWSGVVVALVSPFCAFLLNIGPRLIQIVPAIAVGNLIFVITLSQLYGKKPPLWRQALTVLGAAGLKFAVLYAGVNHLVIPMMGEALKPKQVATFQVMFSWPQAVTAVIGGTLAMLILPVLKKAMKD